MQCSNQITILLVEDNTSDAEIAMAALDHQRIANAVVWVQDGQEALDYVWRRNKYRNRLHGDPDLIVLDLSMPRVGGIEVTRQLKGDPGTRDIPIIIMTSSKADQDIVETYNLGTDCYLVKPLDFTAFAAVTRQLGFSWLAVENVA